MCRCHDQLLFESTPPVLVLCLVSLSLLCTALVQIFSLIPEVAERFHRSVKSTFVLTKFLSPLRHDLLVRKSMAYRIACRGHILCRKLTESTIFVGPIGQTAELGTGTRYYKYSNIWVLPDIWTSYRPKRDTFTICVTSNNSWLTTRSIVNCFYRTWL